MMHHELKHCIDGGGKFKLKWQWGLPPATQPQEYKWFRWAHFHNMEDLNEYLERYVKVWFPEEKYEIEEINERR